MSKKNVYLSAGHSGEKEQGAKSKWLNEKQAAAELCCAIKTESHQPIGLRLSTPGLKLAERVAEANGFCGKCSGVAVEVHFNAGGGTGCEAVVSNNASAASIKVANNLASITSQALNLKNRGVKRVSQSGRSRLAFVDDTLCPAVILEVCFVDSEADCKAYAAAKGELVYELADYFDHLYL